ncbi:hypothetical protein [Limnoglobus roseus]|uniref:Uncharacterized protein n=1 Tax=Limnoglobus roseus TaxID=2598579 RepID=A0A5C1AH16_9BACT|nr:hypothetical protein [Limnoglobus roseus]QEL17543.1 hypothetical protein PX52LOC_04533 [Limnoglobus roseus]
MAHVLVPDFTDAALAATPHARLAEGVHDINNQLAAAILAGECLRLVLPAHSPSQQYVDKILRACSQAARDSRRLRDDVTAMIGPADRAASDRGLCR